MRTIVSTSVLAIACAGCITTSRSDVVVRDPTKVDLVSPKGESLLPPDDSDAVVDRGKYGRGLWRVPYETRAYREPNGAIALHCDAPPSPPFPLYWGTHLDLLSASGRLLPTYSSCVDLESSGVAVSYGRGCMLPDRRACPVPPPVGLVAPASDLVEVRRRVEPVRVWGYILLGMSALAGALTVVAFASSSGDSLGTRALWTGIPAVPFLTFGGIGLWEVLTQPEEQVWKPNVAFP